MDWDEKLAGFLNHDRDLVFNDSGKLTFTDEGVAFGIEVRGGRDVCNVARAVIEAIRRDGTSADGPHPIPDGQYIETYFAVLKCAQMFAEVLRGKAIWRLVVRAIEDEYLVGTSYFLTRSRAFLDIGE